MAEPEKLPHLAKIREEIDAALMTARVALITSSDVSAIRKRLPVCLEHLEQVRGALELIKLPGAAMVLEEMLQLTRTLLEPGQAAVQHPRAAVDALVRALLQLPGYLEQLEQGVTDSPYMTQPLIDALRAARGVPPLTQIGLFSPRIDIDGDDTALAGEALDRLSAIVERLHPVYERALSEWKEQPAEKEYARQLALIMRGLVEAGVAAGFRQLFEIAEAVFILLGAGKLSLQPPLAQLLDELGEQLARLADGEAEESWRKAPEELMKALLYHIACVSGGDEKVDVIRERYRLEEVFPSEKTVARVHARLKGPDSGATQSALSALRSEMDSIKKALEGLFRDGVRQGEAWLPVVDGLKQLVTTLDFLELAVAARWISEQIEILRQVASGQRIADETCLTAVAEKLLMVESVLKGGINESELAADDAANTVLLVEAESGNVRRDTCNEIISELNRVKAMLEDAPSNLQRKESLPALKVVGGALEMLQLEEAGRLTRTCFRYIDTAVGNVYPLQRTQLENLAELIVTVESYLQAVAAGQPEAEKLLESVQPVAAELHGSSFPPDAPGDPEGEEHRAFASIIKASMASAGGEPPVDSAPEEEGKTASGRQDTATPPRVESAVEVPVSGEAGEGEVAGQGVVEGSAGDGLEGMPVERSDSGTDTPAVVPDHEPSPYVPARDPRLLDIFVEEVQGHLATIRKLAANRECGGDAGGAEEALLRVLHTVHGSALTAGANDFARLSGALENHLEKLVDKRLPVQGGLLELLEDSCDAIEAALASLSQSGMELELADTDALLQRIDMLDELLETPAEPAAPLSPEQQAEMELLRTFSDECGEILDRYQGHLLQWRRDRADKMPLQALERELHTLKGSARVAGVGPVADISHVLESLLSEVSAGRVDLSDALFELLGDVHRQLLEMAGQLKGGYRPEDAPGLIGKIREFVADSRGVAQQSGDAFQPQESSPGVNRERIRLVQFPLAGSEHQQAGDDAPQSRLSPDQIRIRADLIDSMVGMAGEAVVSNSRIRQRVEGVGQNVDELHRTVERLRDQLRRLDIEAESQMLSNSGETQQSSGEQFDPLELDRFSRKQVLVRGIMESLNDLSSLDELLTEQIKQSSSLLHQQGEVTRELQDRLNRSRLQSFSDYLPRLHRVVEQACGELGKQVELYVEGAGQELDRSMLVRVLPAVEHILRNAVTHGIELPPQRLDVGKPEKGRVTIRLERHGSDMLIRIDDDGAGLDLDGIRSKAIDAGYLRADTPFTEEQAVKFIQQAGFSTAESVTQLAGRGIGLDVVKNEIHHLGGTVQVRSRSGEGVRFTLRLPLIRYLSSALLVEVGSETYALPPMGIEGITRIGDVQIHNSGQEGEQHSWVECLGQRYRIEVLADRVGVEQPHRWREGGHGIAILLRVAEHRLAVVVDKVLGEREILMKSFGPQLSRIKGIPGATFLEDGSIVLILDLAAFIESGECWRKEMPPPKRVAENRACDVLVVDDSITVRSVMTRFLERHGMRVSVAKDGMEGLLMLEEQRPDVILMDVEMPHMNGYELTRYIRSDAALKEIPVIMISSRSGEKHRQQAQALGVDVYLSKPYREEELLEHIQRFQMPARAGLEQRK